MNSKRTMTCLFALFCVAIMIATSVALVVNNVSKDATPEGDNGFDIDHIRYSTNDATGTARVIGHSVAITLVVPDTIEHNGRTYVVNKIDNGGLQGMHRERSCGIPYENTPLEVEIGPNIEEIGHRALSMDTVVWGSEPNLEKFTIRDVEHSKLRVIGDSAFRDQCKLKTVTLPASLQIMKNSAFRNCQNLTTVNLSSKNLEIWESAFRGDRSLVNIDLSGVTVLGNGAFHDCKSLAKADLSSIKSIAKTSFRSCPLEKVVFGDNLQSIKSDSFYKTTFYDRSGNALKMDVNSLRGHAFERIDGKLRMVS